MAMPGDFVAGISMLCLIVQVYLNPFGIEEITIIKEKMQIVFL